MARGFNALRAALGAVTGVAEGLQQRELLAEKRKRDEEIMARQQAMDLASLMAQGWQRPEDITQKTGEARGAIGSLVGSALQAASTGMPAGGPSARGMQALESGYATQQAPSRTINVGGMDLSLRETPAERQERLASTQAVQQRVAKENEARAAAQARQGRIEEYKSLGFTPDQATALTDELAKYGDVRETPSVVATKRGQDITRRGQDLSYAASMAAAGRSDRDYELRLREQQRREADSQRRRESFPVSVQGKLAGLESGVLMANDVRTMIQDNPGAIGPVKGRAWRAILDATDKAGVGVRASIESLSGEIRNQRFGGALTASEAKFAEGMLPSEKDTAEAALAKLGQLESYLERKREGFFRVYKQPYERITATPSEAGGGTGSVTDALAKIRGGK